MLSSGLSSFHPLTRNPWDLSKNPGGSSSGAGAAGAAGYGPLHLGTDIGGSVRLPACWCGLVALKPSLGRVPVDPPYVGRVAGPMTRTVDDAALMMSVLSKPDRRDGMSLPRARHQLEGAGKIAAQIAHRADARSRRRPAAGEGGARSRGESRKGVRVRRRRGHRGRRHFDARECSTASTISGARGCGTICRNCRRASAPRRCPISINGPKPPRKLSGVDVIRGFNATMAIRAAAAKLFCELDYVISPVSPVVNFPAEFASPLNDPAKPFEHICYTVPWNMSENPAVSDQWRLRQERFPDRRADHRPPLRRHRRARHGQGVRGPARPAKTVAVAAEEIASVIPGRRAATNPESRHSPVRNCAPGVWSFGPSRNDGLKSQTNKTQEENTNGV